MIDLENIPINRTVPTSEIRESSSLWLPIMTNDGKFIKIYEALEVLSDSICKQIQMIKCQERCCMNWSVYHDISCVSSRNTKCSRLHQICLCNQILKDLSDDIQALTRWDLHFIMCESMSSSSKEALHLNRLNPIVDFNNLMLINPNSFPITVILNERLVDKHEKHQSKRRGGCSGGKPGSCQISIILLPGKILCFTEETVLHWKIYSASSISNYIVCVMGRYNTKHWIVDNLLSGKRLSCYSNVE